MNGEIPKYVKIKNKIRKDIKSGKIGGKLPGERVLAKEFEVSYMTVRKAIMELEEEGILHKFTTKGTFVSNNKMSPKITHNIGFFLDEGIKEGISSPYYSLVFKALEESVKKHGYNLLLFSDHDDINPLNNQKKIDGVIICCFPRIETKVQELKKVLPLVLLDNLATDKSIPSVTIDNFNGCSASAQYLISLGHTRIAFISGLLDSDVSKDRLQGYSTTLINNKIAVDKTLIFKGDYSYESGEKAAKYFLSLEEPPTAILCANDSMAIGTMKVIRENGLNIPDDISVVGFDDIEVASRVFPPLTTVAAPITEMVEKAVNILLSAVQGKDVDYQHVILPAELIVRDSSSAFKK
jgi:DNA-binding LacI/PurR family transcriptional regulator